MLYQLFWLFLAFSFLGWCWKLLPPQCGWASTGTVACCTGRCAWFTALPAA